jgi:hypothetical protein
LRRTPRSETIPSIDIDPDLIPARLVDAPSGERAVLYARLFWPDFVEVDGMIFLEGSFEDEADMRLLREAIDRYGGDRRRIEESLNFHEIGLMFGGLAGISDEDADWLAERLAGMWNARLHSLFPTREFAVDVVRPAPSEGHELGVCFYERRS